MTSEEPKPKVLAVDDEVGNLETLQRSFRREFELTVVTSGAAALEALRREDFDVVLADYSMPGMNGLELLQQLPQIAPNTQGIMVTAHSDLREVRAATKEGLSAALVAKPWDREHLLRLVVSFARLSRIRRSSEARRTKPGGPA